MKASLKVRQDEKPLVRAKVPLNLCGLPLFTGVTSGDPHELALHVGTYSDAGPAVRFSYKPNNAASPFAVLLKTGFGVWGSPQGAAVAVSAELNLSSTGTPTFSFRLKPKFGDFGFQKDSRRVTVAFTSTEGKDRQASSLSFEEKMKTLDGGGEEKRGEASLRTLSYDGFSSPNGSPTDLSPPGKLETGLNAGGGTFSVKEKIQKILEKGEILKSDGKPNGPLDQYKDGSSDSGSIEDGFTPVFVRQPHSRSEGEVEKVTEESKRGLVESWIGATTNGWSMSAHSALPIGSRAIAKVRWSMRFGSNEIHKFREGFSITDIRLPTLNVDKFSIEAIDPLRRYRGNPTFETTDITNPGFGYNVEDNNPQMGRIAAMCVSMRYQLQLLHSENKMLKKSVEELRSEIASKKVSVKAAELLMQEENALRSQLFDELSGKTDVTPNSKATGKSVRGKLREGNQAKDSSSKIESHEALRSGGNKAPIPTGTDFTSTVDPVSEELKKAIMNATGG